MCFIKTSCSLTVVGVVAYLLLQVVGGDVVWLRPLTWRRWLEFSTAAVAAAAEAAAAVKAGQNAANHEQTLKETRDQEPEPHVL